MNHENKQLIVYKRGIKIFIQYNKIMKKSFTLLEMLVVIGIISVLVSMGFASYSTAQKKARDAKRQADLKSFQSAMEQCYSVNTYAYPTITGGGTTSIAENCPAAGGPDLTITDPSSKVYTITNSPAYTVSVPLEGGGTFTISNQQ